MSTTTTTNPDGTITTFYPDGTSVTLPAGSTVNPDASVTTTSPGTGSTYYQGVDIGGLSGKIGQDYGYCYTDAFGLCNLSPDPMDSGAYCDWNCHYTSKSPGCSWNDSWQSCLDRGCSRSGGHCVSPVPGSCVCVQEVGSSNPNDPGYCSILPDGSCQYHPPSNGTGGYCNDSCVYVPNPPYGCQPDYVNGCNDAGCVNNGPNYKCVRSSYSPLTCECVYQEPFTPVPQNPKMWTGNLKIKY
jgi:hypothetical protein